MAKMVRCNSLEIIRKFRRSLHSIHQSVSSSKVKLGLLIVNLFLFMIFNLKVISLWEPEYCGRKKLEEMGKSKHRILREMRQNFKKWCIKTSASNPCQLTLEKSKKLQPHLFIGIRKILRKPQSKFLNLGKEEKWRKTNALNMVFSLGHLEILNEE